MYNAQWLYGLFISFIAIQGIMATSYVPAMATEIIPHATDAFCTVTPACTPYEQQEIQGYMAKRARQCRPFVECFAMVTCISVTGGCIIIGCPLCWLASCAKKLALPAILTS